MDNRYNLRGVSAAKEDVHNAIKNIDKGIFPKAFCKIIPDILGGDDEYCNIMHADGAGTKSSLAYMYWKETGDINVWKGIAQDAIVMNTDDELGYERTRTSDSWKFNKGTEEHTLYDNGVLYHHYYKPIQQVQEEHGYGPIVETIMKLIEDGELNNDIQGIIT